MEQLRQLDLRADWIYEVVISTAGDGLPHAAPMGVWTTDFSTLQMEIFRGSQTLSNILATGYFVANFPADACMLATALLTPHELVYEKARTIAAPILCGCLATVELSLEQATALPDRTQVRGTVQHVDRGHDLRLLNRAENLLLESLILATRLQHLDHFAAATALTENYRVVCRVAPKSSYEQAMAALLQNLGLPS